MSFAILRFEKIKSLSDLKGMSGHWDRSRPTPNADPQAKPGAVQFLHGGDPIAEVEKRLPEKRRKDAVLCMEGLLSASPEYFRPDNPNQPGVYDPKRTEAWAKASMAWLKKEFGDRLASAVLHLDEATPHIQVAIVPLDRKTGRLDAKTQFGRSELRRFQTDYAKALKHLGIRRGVEGSQAKHQDVQRYYGLVNAAQEPPELTLRDKAALTVGRTTQTVEQILAQAADSRTVRDELRKVQSRLRASEDRANRERTLRIEAETARDAALDQAKQARKALASQVREIPLPTVLPHLGYVRARKDQDVDWDGPAGPLRTGAGAGKPGKFYLEELGKGGRGAIDLVKAVMGTDYAGAVAWLSRFFEEEALVAEAAAQAAAHTREAAEKARSRPPEPVLKLSQDPKDLALVRETLDSLGLDERMIENLHRLNMVGAARFGRRPHLVFPLFPVDADDPEQAAGYVIHDLTQQSVSLRRFGKPGLWFYAKAGSDEGANQEVQVLVRTPIEALALLKVVEQGQGIIPPLEDKKIQVISVFAIDSLAQDQFAPVVEYAKKERARLILGLRDDDRGRRLTRVFADEAEKQGVAASSLTGILQWAGVQNFLQLWLEILRQGAERIKERIAAAKAEKAKRLAAEAARRGQGRG